MRPVVKKLVLFTVSKLSWLICPVLRLWSKHYLKGKTEPHWLFLKLKFHLQMRIWQRAKLVTGQEIDVDPFEDVGGAIARNGCHEPATVVVFQKLLAPGMIVFDLGAHIGQYTLIASQLIGDSGWVHSFEPDPKTFKQLQSNVRLNGCNSVTCNPIALSNRHGTATLYLFTTLE
jgi:hypothetical protein